MGSLPIALTPKKTLLIGAGSVAMQKHKVLIALKWEVCILAKEITHSYFRALDVAKKTLDVKDSALFKEFEVIIDASGDEILGKFLWENKKHFGYLLNVVDNPKYCDFYFGALAQVGDVNVLVSTNGASPILAQNIRDKILRILPKNIALLANALKEKRKITKPRVEEREIIAKSCKEALGKVFLIGCGPNSLDLLTLRAYESLFLLDVALIDHLVGNEIVALLQSLGVECISVAKEKGRHSVIQDEINVLMLKFAKEGKCVGRLKGGDPLIFGRLFEEVAFLQERGIEVEIISGISASLNGALSSGIYPTLRGVSAGVLIVSAHLKESVFHAQWLEWLKNSPYTLIVMMAHSFAHKIVEKAREIGIDMDMPAAFVAKIDSKEQKSVIGTLGKLEKMAQMCEKPAILILGKTIESCACMPYCGQRVVI